MEKTSNMRKMLHKCINNLEDLLVYMESNNLGLNKNDLKQLERDEKEQNKEG
jgi:hypothetical protein